MLIYHRSSELAFKFIGDAISQFKLEFVNLFVGQAAIHMPVVYSETVALTLCLWVHEFVNELHSLCKVATNAPDQLEKFVLVEIFLEPERDILVADRELAV